MARISQSDIIPGQVKQRHLEAWIIFSGTDAAKPTVGTTDTKAYFAQDTGKLYLWNGTKFVAVTLA